MAKVGDENPIISQMDAQRGVKHLWKLCPRCVLRFFEGCSLVGQPAGVNKQHTGQKQHHTGGTAQRDKHNGHAIMEEEEEEADNGGRMVAGWGW